MKGNKSRKCFRQSGKTHDKEKPIENSLLSVFARKNWRGSHGFPPLAPIWCCQWFGARCMRIFLRLTRFACFPALTPISCCLVVWRLLRACFPALGTRCISSFISHISQLWSHLFWLVSKGSTPRLEAIISSGNLTYPRPWLMFTEQLDPYPKRATGQ